MAMPTRMKFRDIHMNGNIKMPQVFCNGKKITMGHLANGVIGMVALGITIIHPTQADIIPGTIPIVVGPTTEVMNGMA